MYGDQLWTLDLRFLKSKIAVGVSNNVYCTAKTKIDLFFAS